MSDYAQALANFGALIDEKTGIISSVKLVKITDLDLNVYVAHAEPCDTSPLTGIQASNRGAASSPSMERAIVRACGESIERYCSAFFDVREMRLASEAEMANEGHHYVGLSELYPFADWQYEQAGFPYDKVGPDRRIRWVPGASLMSGETIWLPGSCVYLPYLFDVAVEPFTHMPISTGLAAGPSIEACIHKGIMEIVERDALMVRWYARMAAPRIDPVSCYGLSSEIDSLLDAAQSGGPTWTINLLTTDIDIPVICAILINSDTPPLTSFGISANLDPVHALLLALEEAALTRMLLNRSQELIDDPAYVHERVITLRDHLLAHATSPDLVQRLHFLTKDGPLSSFEDSLSEATTKETKTIADRLSDARLDAIWVDVTTPDVADLGFHVVRTVMPQLQPLDNDHRYRYLGGPRLLSVPAKMGYGNLTFDMLNPDPHPFP